jgi:hypothetical protein
MWLLAALVLCRRHGMSNIRLWGDGMLESWPWRNKKTKVSLGKNNGLKRITSVFEKILTSPAHFFGNTSWLWIDNGF